MDTWDHKVHISLEYQSVSPVVRVGTPPTPCPTSECVPPQNQKGGTHSPADEGVGGPNSDDRRKSLSFCLLCAWDTGSWMWNTEYYSYIEMRVMYTWNTECRVLKTLKCWIRKEYWPLAIIRYRVLDSLYTDCRIPGIQCIGFLMRCVHLPGYWLLENLRYGGPGNWSPEYLGYYVRVPEFWMLGILSTLYLASDCCLLGIPSSGYLVNWVMENWDTEWGGTTVQHAKPSAWTYEADGWVSAVLSSGYLEILEHSVDNLTLVRGRTVPLSQENIHPGPRQTGFWWTSPSSRPAHLPQQPHLGLFRGTSTWDLCWWV